MAGRVRRAAPRRLVLGRLRQPRGRRIPDAPYLGTYERLSTNPRPHFTLDFLHRGQALLRYVPINPDTLDADLARAIGGRRVVHVIGILQAGKQESRPTGAGIRHLQSAGQPGGVERTSSYTIVTVRLSRALTEDASEVGPPPAATERDVSQVPFPKGFAAVLGVWLVAAAGVAATGALERLPRPALQVIIVALTVALLLACRAATSLRTWAMRGDLRWLVGLHVSRLAAGLAFLGYASQGELPWGFATPAGVGDAVVAVLAAGVCLRPHRGLVLAWNGLGFLDILGVVVAAARFGIADLASMAALARLPLSLLPTFLVPLIIASHVVIFARYAPARR